MDPKTNQSAAELFLKSFAGDYDAESAWDAVLALRLQGSDEVFELAMEYIRSAIPIHRARSLDVLAQLGAGKPRSERPHFEASVSTARKHLADSDPIVVQSAAWALAHLRDDRSIEALLEMKHCPDPDVRHAIACGLHGSNKPEAIQRLIELMDDTDENVRDWETFAIGTSTIEGSMQPGALDSPEIRDTLKKRLADPFPDARDEALWGLARRKDPSALQALLDRLNSETWIAGDEMTAADVLGLSHQTSVDELREGLRKVLNLNHTAGKPIA